MNIGLIAHDSKKKLMQNFCIAYRGILSKNALFSTGTTGRLIEEVTNLSIHKFLAGHLGGEQQIGAQIEQNEIDLMIFLRDPTAPKSFEPDVGYIIRLCDIHNIPLATNLATAELLIKSLDRGDMEWREMYK
ncbi:MAG: methylglyoxal synthase [Lachnospiraceae bacterium]|nr:methylglyoxal synthase [Lachnospiraceae bacterium]